MEILDKAEKKVCIVVTYTYPYIGSGIGNIARIQAEELAKNNFLTTIISSNIPKTKKRFMHNNVKYIKIWSTDFLEKFKIPVPIFLPNFRVFKEIQKSDIVHVHDIIYPSSFFAAIYAKLFNKPLILTQHVGYVKYKSEIIELIQKIVYNTQGRIILHWANKIIYYNSNVKNWIIDFKIDKTKLVFLPNWVNREIFKPVKKEIKQELRIKYNLPINKKIILFVGRFVPKKGFDKLIKIANEKYLIIFIGEGEIPLKTDFVRVYKAMPQEKLCKFYQLSDLFVLPSINEGFPLAIQEAMCSGLPIITTDHPGYREYINDSEVRLIKPSIEQIKESINEIIYDNNKMNSLKENAFKTAIKLFDEKKCTEQLIKIYCEALK